MHRSLVGGKQACRRLTCQGVIQAKRVANGKHLLAHKQVGRVAKADSLEVMHFLLRAQQLQDGHILVRVPADELQQQMQMTMHFDSYISRLSMSIRLGVMHPLCGHSLHHKAGQCAGCCPRHPAFAWACQLSEVADMYVRGEEQIGWPDRNDQEIVNMWWKVHHHASCPVALQMTF